MLHGYTLTLATLCLVLGDLAIACVQQRRDTDMSSSKFSKKALDIYECFSQTVDVDWGYLDDERWRVSRFLNYTEGYCHESSWRVFECYYPLLEAYNEINRLVTIGNEYMKRHKANKTLHDLEKGTEIQQQGLDTLKRLVHDIEEILEVAKSRNESRVFRDLCSLAYFDLEEKKNAIIRDEPTVYFNHFLVLWNQIHLRYLPPVYIIMFTFGILGNGILLLIFLRHSEIRKGFNLLLANLAVNDTLLLIIQIAFEWSIRYWRHTRGDAICYIYNFVKTTTLTASVYSMTALSIIRFTAVGTMRNNKCHGLIISMPFVISAVWIMALIAAIPNTLHTQPDCKIDYNLWHSIFNFVAISLLPLIIIANFSIATSRRLKKSAQNMPGEAIGHTKAKTARERGARILPALAVLFAITYLPWHLFWAAMTIFNLRKEPPALVWIYHVTSVLINVNSALNPVALYLSSTTFRKYFNQYLFKAAFAKCRRMCGISESKNIE